MRVAERALAAIVATSFALAGAASVPASINAEQQCDQAALPAPPAQRPFYALTVHVAANLRTAHGALGVRFTPERATDRLVFRLWPNAPQYARTGARLSVTSVREGRRALPVSRPDPTTLVVARPVAAGERVVVSMTWSLVLPRERGVRLKGGGTSMRLASFFPLLAWDGSDWALDPAPKLRSETWTAPTADFDVLVTKPKQLRVLATGNNVVPGHWRAEAVRDFTLALARFTVLRGTAHTPAPVQITVGVEAARGALAARTFLGRAVASVERYSALYGRYPWRTYTVAAMADLLGLSGGYEYPTLVYQPSTGENIPHETGHQWFYSLVGNNQARDPWLDEGLATWAEAALTGAPPFAGAPIPPEVANRLGEPMSFWEQFDYRLFFLGAYLQGYRALLALGPRAEVDCALRRYVHDNAYRTATPRDLLTALQAFFPDAQQKLEAFGARF